MINDTIVAPVTSFATQAISVIRLSGPNSYEIINKVLDQSLNKSSFKVYLRKIMNKKQVVDEVLLSCFTSPKSFTGEDVIEINCHGGILITKEIIQLLIEHGARLALNGEYSQRAFLNGKINLIEAEAINNLIHATNSNAKKLAQKNLFKKSSSKISQLKDNLLDIVANIEVNIDYPEYDGVGDITTEDLKDKLFDINKELQETIFYSKIGKQLNEGINVLILGQPNVGKSSLLNALANEDRAIVSDIAGTTRDIIETKINLDDISLNIIDTAGIRKTKNKIETLGIEKAKNEIGKADLVLYVLDGTKKLSKKDLEILELVKVNDKKLILVVNKEDLAINKDLEQTIKDLKESYLKISAKNQKIKSLVDKIKEIFLNEELFKDNTTVLVDINQIAKLEQCHLFIKQALENVDNNMPPDIINIDLNNAWSLLQEILGNINEESLLDEMFRKYCLGK
ncbi:tRNA uridine-5-carboxymethylaminomethyl(34) synthesis GTPase MnmE [Spiroplasma endosymbiont of Anurida maritima]|uniref:tRNA uridine-5-carboxymethylaminomethyl(34) synthesis GTPase MnmE n=1 Tax=Spiroplasma endosymbiont of Anurida maritima TaxID=2967972 RepID=UPI0036D2201E